MWWSSVLNQAGIYLLKVNNKNTTLNMLKGNNKVCNNKVSLLLTSDIFHIVFLLLSLNMQLPAGNQISQIF